MQQPLDPAALAALVQTIILEHGTRHRAEVIAPDQNILEFVDSFGLVNVLLALESRLDITLDLADVDLASLTRFGDFLDFVAGACQADRRAAQG